MHHLPEHKALINGGNSNQMINNNRITTVKLDHSCGHKHTGKCIRRFGGIYAYLDDRYSNLFLNAYINHHAFTEYFKMIEVYSPLGIALTKKTGLW